MIPLYSIENFNNSKSKDLLPLQCEYCKTQFYKTKHSIQKSLLVSDSHTNQYCSRKCKELSSSHLIISNCSNCNKQISKRASELKKIKSDKCFCSKSCSASFNNKNKKTGNRRSKLEIWIESQLSVLYPNLKVDYNKSDTIGSELDIYISSLNIAFELNGIFHYEPIFGIKKFNQIQENDLSKSKACIDAKIDLCVIDTSSLKYFKITPAQKYLDIITKIIKERLLTS